MEQLQSHKITGITGDIVYGVEPPSRLEITKSLNELVEKLKASQYKSGYLISKFGKLKL